MLPHQQVFFPRPHDDSRHHINHTSHSHPSHALSDTQTLRAEGFPPPHHTPAPEPLLGPASLLSQAPLLRAYIVTLLPPCASLPDPLLPTGRIHSRTLPGSLQYPHAMEVPAAHESEPPSAGQKGQQSQAVGRAAGAGAGAGPSSQLDLVSQLHAAQAANGAQAATIKSQAAKLQLLEDEVRSLQQLRGGVSSTSRAKEAAPLSLLLLPPEVLELVASKVVGKAALHSSCRSLRLAVNACTSQLTWSGPRLCVAAAGEGAPPYVTLHLAQPAAPLTLQLLNCSGQPDEPLRIHSLAGCPPTVHTLICSHTLVAELGPLAACTLLEELDCSSTRVAELGPLAACTMLQELDCNNTGVAELGPLAACMLLQNLKCSNTKVVELGPLAACTLLQTLNCSSTGVTELGPLAACTLLQTIKCS